MTCIYNSLTVYWWRFLWFSPQLLSASQSGGWGWPLDGGCRVIKRKASSGTVASNVFGECHFPYMLEISFVDFEKREEAL